MKKYIIITGLLFLAVNPAFARRPITALSIQASYESYSLDNTWSSLAGLGLNLEFMIGEKVYFYNSLFADYLMNTSALDKLGSVQAGFMMGFGAVLKDIIGDDKGVSVAMNFAPLGIGVDYMAENNIKYAFYRMFFNMPIRFHYNGTRAVQIAPYISLGLHTVNSQYRILFSSGGSVGLTF